MRRRSLLSAASVAVLITALGVSTAEAGFFSQRRAVRPVRTVPSSQVSQPVKQVSQPVEKVQSRVCVPARTWTTAPKSVSHYGQWPPYR